MTGVQTCALPIWPSFPSFLSHHLLICSSIEALSGEHTNSLSYQLNLKFIPCLIAIFSHLRIGLSCSVKIIQTLKILTYQQYFTLLVSSMHCFKIDLIFLLIILVFSILSKICIKVFQWLMALHLQFMKFIVSLIQALTFSTLYYSKYSNFISFSIRYLLSDNYEVKLFSDSNYESVPPSLKHLKSLAQYFFSVLRKVHYQPSHILQLIVARSFFFNCK